MLSDTFRASPEAATVKTTCAYCGVGCGIEVKVLDAGSRRIAVQGDAAHPANFGRLCSKGSSLGETVGLEGRQLYPEIQGQRVSWPEATGHIAERFNRIRAEHGPDAVAFYMSGQLLTEDYYVANKLMKGFIGTANIETNSRLCMSSAVAGHKRAFGSDTVPGSYEDIDHAELIVLVGSNTAWCHPIIFQRIKAAKAQRPNLKVVVVDPRATATLEIADLHLPVRAGSDVLLFNAVLAELAARGALDAAYIAAHTQGFDQALQQAQQETRDRAAVAATLGVAEASLQTFLDWFVATPKTLTLFSMGVNQSSAGTDKVNAIINCHLATGRLGKPGASPMSLTGQPNAMGGREVGGLANMLAAHLDLDDASHRDLVRRFWRSPDLPQQEGLKTVDLFEAIHSGRVKAVWIAATNPVVSLPDADRVREALAQCEFVVVSDCIADTDTMRLAHVRLPALGWGEKDGTVTNTERRISRQRGFLPAPGEARPDWWALAEVGKAMGFGEAFEYDGPAAVFREHAALSAFENAPSGVRRDFNIGALAALDAAGYDALSPVQWPVLPDAPNGTSRLFADGRFFTPDRQARFMAVQHRAPLNAPSAAFPLVLNTGRIRDQWHTMTRTGLTPRLLQHIGESFAELHPDDAKNLGIVSGDLVEVESRWGKVIVRATVSASQQPGAVFVPMHWTDVLARSGRIGAVVNPVVDPLSGQPENKHTPVAVRRYAGAWHGFLLSPVRLDLPACDYAVAIRMDGGWRYELAHALRPDDWQDRVSAWLKSPQGEQLEYQDFSRHVQRYGWVEDGKLSALAFFGPEPELPPRAWLMSMLGQPLDALSRRALLSGKPADPDADVGRIVCACFGVGEKTICRSIQKHGLDSVAAIGHCLKAGSNCGSCQPELKKLLESQSVMA